MVDPSQTFTATGVFSGTGALNKSGTGTLVTTGSNTYSGGSAINAGALLVNNSSGSGTGTGTVTVNNSGTLGGTGTISGSVTVNSGGTINPGPAGANGTSAAVGTLNTGSLTMTGGTAIFDISSTSNSDQLFVTGTVTLGTTATLQLNIAAGLNFLIGSQYMLINNDGTADAISGVFSNAANGSTVNLGGYNFTVNYAGGDGNDFVLTAVPEPSTWATAVLACLAMGYSMRRRIGKRRTAESVARSRLCRASAPACRSIWQAKMPALQFESNLIRPIGPVIDQSGPHGIVPYVIPFVVCRLVGTKQSIKTSRLPLPRRPQVSSHCAFDCGR
jgi:autotransporter-associated beta strand protein